MKPQRIKTISEFHRMNRLAPPEHPLISVVDYAKVAAAKKHIGAHAIVADYYSVSVKRGLEGKMRYGQMEYDFDEGVMYFLAPGQVLQPSPIASGTVQPSGWILLIHPDFLWGSHLSKSIKQYAYFDYAVNEALFLSEKEETIINAIVQNIRHEYQGNTDKFSQGIILSHLDSLLNYAERFYQRQFLTRKIPNHKILDRLEELLSDHFSGDPVASNGLPTVQHLSDSLNISPSYLSSLLKSLTGQNAQQHIHNKLIEAAKEKLSTTDLTVSEIAYDLGFEHAQSFSKLFKTKTNTSPLEFRRSFS
ncbi:MAG TPA: helix-turn-helix domain-containing protein [Chryseolinea sp.]|nr:helix-turn-helix domain-containing protein [Chryseolinea sp.]